MQIEITSRDGNSASCDPKTARFYRKAANSNEQLSNQSQDVSTTVGRKNTSSTFMHEQTKSRIERKIT